MLTKRTTQAEPPTSAGRSRRDSGVTYVEILVSVILLGIGAVGVLVATTTAITASRANDEIAKLQAGIAEAADFLTDTEPQQVPFQSCDVPGVRDAYQAALDTRFGAGAVEVVEVTFWNRTVDGFGTTCRDASDGDRLQKVTIRTVDDGVQRTVSVVKRPTSIPTLDLVAAPPVPPYVGGSGQATVSPTPLPPSFP